MFRSLAVMMSPAKPAAAFAAASCTTIAMPTAVGGKKQKKAASPKKVKTPVEKKEKVAKTPKSPKAAKSPKAPKAAASPKKVRTPSPKKISAAAAKKATAATAAAADVSTPVQASLEVFDSPVPAMLLLAAPTNTPNVGYNTYMASRDYAFTAFGTPLPECRPLFTSFSPAPAVAPEAPRETLMATAQEEEALFTADTHVDYSFSAPVEAAVVEEAVTASAETFVAPVEEVSATPAAVATVFNTNPEAATSAEAWDNQFQWTDFAKTTRDWEVEIQSAQLNLAAATAAAAAEETPVVVTSSPFEPSAETDAVAESTTSFEENYFAEAVAAPEPMIAVAEPNEQVLATVGLEAGFDAPAISYPEETVATTLSANDHTDNVVVALDAESCSATAAFAAAEVEAPAPPVEEEKSSSYTFTPLF